MSEYKVGDQVRLNDTSRTVGTILSYDNGYYKIHWSDDPPDRHFTYSEGYMVNYPRVGEKSFSAEQVAALVRKGAKQEGLCDEGVDKFLEENGINVPRPVPRHRVVIEYDGREIHDEALRYALTDNWGDKSFKIISNEEVE